MSMVSLQCEYGYDFSNGEIPRLSKDSEGNGAICLDKVERYETKLISDPLTFPY